MLKNISIDLNERIQNEMNFCYPDVYNICIVLPVKMMCVPPPDETINQI